MNLYLLYECVRIEMGRAWILTFVCVTRVCETRFADCATFESMSSNFDIKNKDLQPS